MRSWRVCTFASLLCLFAIVASGCCGTQQQADPGSPAGLDLEPVIAQPISGICLPLPFGCRICLGIDCDPLIQPAVFGTPVARPAAPAADPCSPVYAAPCGEYEAPAAPAVTPCVDCVWPSGSASDVDPPDYGMPPTSISR